MMSCADTEAKLDGLLDGSLESDEAALIQAHLAGCAGCRAELDALRSLIERARALPLERRPARDLWPAIASRTAARSPFAFGRALRFAVAAALLLAVGAVGSRWLFAPPQPPIIALPDPGPPASDEARLVETVASLRKTLNARRASLSPQAWQLVERNLATIDEALGEIRQALRADPGNPALAQMLTFTYQQKLEAIEQVLELMERG